MRKVLMLSMAVLLVLVVLVCSVFATFSPYYWYAYDLDENPVVYMKQIAYWSGSPTIKYDKMISNADFPFLTGLNNGVTQWNSALSRNMSVSAIYTSPDIIYFGGTAADIDSLGLFASVPSAATGRTLYEGLDLDSNPRQSLKFTFSYGGENDFICYEQLSAIGYVVYNGTSTYYNYIKTCTHELGHAVGWRGHSLSDSNVMWQGKSAVTSLQSVDINHLKQLYDTIPTPSSSP